jgi:hypothetical protein
MGMKPGMGLTFPLNDCKICTLMLAENVKKCKNDI